MADSRPHGLAMNDNPLPVLELRNLTTMFPTQRGSVRAVEGVNLSVYPGQILGLVGESGCGKSTVLLSILRLIAKPGEIEQGEILLDGTDLRGLSQDEIRKIRGKDIAMIFQDPLSTLNPAFHIGEQIRESLRLHKMIPGHGWPLNRSRTAREKKRVLEVMTEVVAVARAEEVHLEKVSGTLDLDWIALTEAERTAAGSPGLLAKHTLLLAVGARYRRLRSSMLSAIERGRAPAVDFLNGEITSRGKEHHVATPVNAAARDSVWAIARGEQTASHATLRKL